MKLVHATCLLLSLVSVSHQFINGLGHLKLGIVGDVTASEDYTMPHPIWSKQESEGVEVTHRKPKGFVDYAAYGTVSVMRFGFDVMSGYKGQKKLDTLDEKAVLTRYVFNHLSIVAIKISKYLKGASSLRQLLVSQALLPG